MRDDGPRLGRHVPYSPAGVLVCAGCIEDAGGEPDGPGAIVRDWTGR